MQERKGMFTKTISLDKAYRDKKKGICIRSNDMGQQQWTQNGKGTAIKAKIKEETALNIYCATVHLLNN